MIGADASCKACRLHIQRSKVVNGEGSFNRPTLMLVGESPGTEEDLNGKPFTGGAGRVLNAVLMSAGIPRSTIFVTNTCRCRPPNNRTVEIEEVFACQGYLRDEINAVRPNVLVAMGDVAVNHLTGKNLSSWRGSIVDGIGPAFGYKVLITYHPAFVMRMRSMFPVMAEDLRKASLPLIEIPEQYNYYPTRSDIFQMISEVTRDQLPIAVDIETAGTPEDKDDALNFWEGTIIGISFTWRPGQAMQLDQATMLQNWDLIGLFLTEYESQIYANNNFDRGFMTIQKGTRPKVLADVQTLMHLIKADLPKKLDFLRSLYTNIPPYKEIYKTGGKYRPELLSADSLARLNCLDTDVTLRVYLAQKNHISADLLNYCRESEDLALDLKLKGVYLDQTAVATHYAKLLPTMEGLRDKFEETYKVSISSPKQLNRLLYEELGLPKHDDKGKPVHGKGTSTNEKAIQAIGNKLGLVYLNDEDGERFEGDHADKGVLADILEYRGLAKIAGTYCEGAFKALQADNRIHSNWKPNGTVSGRWSCTGYPLQGVPKHMRDIIVAAPGYIYMGADYKGMQIMGAAVLAEDWELCKKMQDPKYSIHNDVLAAIKPHYPSIKKIQAKTVVFGTFFGRSVRDIAMQFHVPVKTAQLWQDIFYSTRPKLRELFEVKSPAYWEKHGYMLGLEGRKMYCDKITEAKNYPVQNFETVVVHAAMVKLKSEGYNIVLNGHDQLVCEEPDDHFAPQRYQRLLEIMRTARTDLYPSFPVEGGMGRTWADI